MTLGTLSGFIDCICLLSFAVVGLYTAHLINTAARRGRKD